MFLRVFLVFIVSVVVVNQMGTTVESAALPESFINQVRSIKQAQLEAMKKRTMESLFREFPSKKSVTLQDDDDIEDRDFMDEIEIPDNERSLSVPERVVKEIFRVVRNLPVSGNKGPQLEMKDRDYFQAIGIMPGGYGQGRLIH